MSMLVGQTQTERGEHYGKAEDSKAESNFHLRSARSPISFARGGFYWVAASAAQFEKGQDRDMEEDGVACAWQLSVSVTGRW
jgi:hypothetical protein